MAKKEKSEAAEKIMKAEKTKAKKPKSDKPNIFARIGKAIARFCKDFKGEIKKIVWPDGKMVLKSTGVVLAAIAVFTVIIWLIDLGLSKSIDLLSNAARGVTESVTEEVPAEATTTAALEAITESTTAATTAAAATEAVTE